MLALPLVIDQTMSLYGPFGSPLSVAVKSPDAVSGAVIDGTGS
jgi:hypothetical protein